jgi:hypothetical protein
MTEANFQRSLQAFVRRQPFRPFSVEFSSGDGFTVDHPEALALRGRVAVFIRPDGHYALFDSSEVTQLIEAAENGGRRTRRRT